MKRLILLLSIIFLLILQSCGPDYNTDFEPPPPNAKLDDVFPSEISGMNRKIERLNLNHPLEGFTASYGDGDITIDAILAPSKPTADDHFKEVIVPRFDKMKNHFRGNINGKWRASGTDEKGRRWFGWVNQNWVFVLNGSTKENFKMAIDAFGFVEE